MNHYDGIIIGAGITGCSIAYHLSVSGVKNLLVIDKAGIASGVTGICPGGVRQQWGTDINCKLSKSSVEFFSNINEILEPDVEIKYMNVGYLYTFHSEESVEKYKKNIDIQNNNDIPTKFITPEEAKIIVPGLISSSFLKASFCETDGFVDDAYNVTKSFADKAKRNGVQFKFAEVLEIKEEGGKVTGVLCQNLGFISADFVVNAAGLSSKKIAQTVGIELPIEFEKRRILYTNRIEERLLEPLLVSFEKGFAAKQLTDGVIYLSYLGKDLGDSYSMFDYQARAAETGMELLDFLDKIEFRTHLDGIYDSTPDHQFILGDVPEINGYYQAVGMSGHGFMMSPAVGQILSEIILKKQPFIDVTDMHINRFAENKLLFEPSVV